MKANQIMKKYLKEHEVLSDYELYKKFATKYIEVPGIWREKEAYELMDSQQIKWEKDMKNSNGDIIFTKGGIVLAYYNKEYSLVLIFP